MTAKDLFDKVCQKAIAFGMDAKNDKTTITNVKGNAIVRENISNKAYVEGKAFFGFLSPEEDPTGAYSDFSFVVFPNNDTNVSACIVCLGVGSLGFKNDFHLASHPGLRRNFIKLKHDDAFFKSSFADIETTASELLKRVKADHPDLTNVIDKYKTVLPAARIVEFKDSEDPKDDPIEVVFQWLATYAKIRDWGTTPHKKEVKNTLKKLSTSGIVNEQKEIRSLLNRRQFVVLQGAPGTGKTWNALQIAKGYDKCFFDQFHAETTYSDFVCGIEPNLGASGSTTFKPKKGILCQALEYAVTNETEKVLLIIDEINRANLSNVLGPVFFLFENNSGGRVVSIKIGGNWYSNIPKNLQVLATMNTADRSLAVVDFALRRRFVWYTLHPHAINVAPPYTFYKDEFQLFADIFFDYATDDELNLQPGQSYFIAASPDEMKERLIYELMPLIKEYLAEGYMLSAKNAFFDLFIKETGKLLYE